MKRINIILAVLLLLLASSLLYSQPPEETSSETSTDTGERTKVLIDFGQFDKVNAEGGIYPKDTEKDWEKDPTKYVVTGADMNLNKWVVRFNSSSDYAVTRQNSYTKSVKTKKGETVLGARIHFPWHNAYAHATVKPPYEIMEYDDKGKLANIGNGVCDNVNIVKEVAVEVSGRNYRNRLLVRVIDQNRKFRDFFMGYLDFIGWKRLVWTNPYYITHVDQRKLFRPKLYPREIPYYKFHSFIISRPENGVIGDFIVYFRKVTMNYDLVFVSDEAITIEDEKTWGIIKRKNLVRQAYMRKLNSDLKQLRTIEAKRLGKNLVDPNKPKTEAGTDSESPTPPTED